MGLTKGKDMLCPETTKKFKKSVRKSLGPQRYVKAWVVVDNKTGQPSLQEDVILHQGRWNIFHDRVTIFLNREYARKFKNKNEHILRCFVHPTDIFGVSRTVDEATVRKLFVQ